MPGHFFDTRVESIYFPFFLALFSSSLISTFFFYFFAFQFKQTNAYTIILSFIAYRCAFLSSCALALCVVVVDFIFNFMSHLIFFIYFFVNFFFGFKTNESKKLV